jgi:ferritin-like metal-binding protein YciE/tetratricopeptide (TPR) repeat protein
MNTADQKIVQYLNEAHASEQALIRALQSQIAMAPRGSYRSGLETHLRETRDHATRVGRRRQALGHGSNPLLAAVGLAESVIGQVLALGKTPFDLVRGSGGEEKVLKNAKDACASEGLEIATYTAIERLARSVGDEETAELAASIRADEEKMLERLLHEIPKLTEAVVRAAVEGERSYDVTATGAADTVREASKPAKNAAGKTTGATKRPARQVRKPPAVARAERQRNGAMAADSDLAIPGYEMLAAGEITGRLSGLSQSELAKIDAYERTHRNRTTILSRIGTLRGDEPSPAGGPARANGADAVPDEHQELRAAAAAEDGAAAFTLWERLRDADFAAAEGWLRTAVELGDARAAHRLGMLLWERRELDAAEATLRRATADPEGAHALGRLLWRERNDPQAAIHWLDRAAQADDPAAERDLGIVLREHGDLHGAHHWLSRAADRDDEARQVLAALEPN